MNRFGFIDSSGIIKKDRFFGAGLLVIKNVGCLNNKLAKNYQSAYNAARENKNIVINKLIDSGKEDEVVNMLRNNKRFEMKFDNLKLSLQPHYKEMIDIFFSDGENRFSAMVIDKDESNFDETYINDAWEAYTGYSATLVLREMRNLQKDKLCLIVDEITKPRSKALSLEETFLSKLKFKTEKDPVVDFANIFGTISIESHSNTLMQLTDVLLGAVMYDFKKKNGLISTMIERKKEELVKKIRETISVDSLARESFTKHSPAYFSVFEAKWNQKNNAR